MDTYAILLALTALLLTLAAAQDDNCYSYSSDEGHFSYPNACGLLLQAGVSMNITWEGIYQHSNLYFIEVGKEYESTPLTVNMAPNGPQVNSNTYANSFLWQLPTEAEGLQNNASVAYGLRVVNADGTPDEQLAGGFFSFKFFIRSDLPGGESSAVSSTVASTTSLSPPSTRTRPHTTSTTSTIISAKKADVTQSSSPAPSVVNSHATGSSSATVVLALSLGIGIPAFLCLLGVIICVMRRRHDDEPSGNSSSRKSDSIRDQDVRAEKYDPDYKRPYVHIQEAYTRTPPPQELFDERSQRRFELPAQ